MIKDEIFVHEINCQIIWKLLFSPYVKYFKFFQKYVSFIVKQSLAKNNKLEFNDNEIKVGVKCALWDKCNQILIQPNYSL